MRIAPLLLDASYSCSEWNWEANGRRCVINAASGVCRALRAQSPRHSVVLSCLISRQLGRTGKAPHPEQTPNKALGLEEGIMSVRLQQDIQILNLSPIL